MDEQFAGKGRRSCLYSTRFVIESGLRDEIIAWCQEKLN
jgi:hypothetical protein